MLLSINLMTLNSKSHTLLGNIKTKKVMHFSRNFFTFPGQKISTESFYPTNIFFRGEIKAEEETNFKNNILIVHRAVD